MCRFWGKDGVPPTDEDVWAVCGAVAVWNSHDAVILAIQNIQFQKKDASKDPGLGSFGGVRF